jgi:lysophospholipase L1-like esterase
MPLIHFEFTKPQADGTDAPSTGLLRLRLINRQPITGKIRTTEPFPAYLVNGSVDVELSVTPAGYGWEVAQYIDGEEPVTEVVIVAADSVNFSDLVRVSARSLKPSAGNVDAWIAALNSLRRGLRNGVAAINSSGHVIDADGNLLLDKATADGAYATPEQLASKLSKAEAGTTYVTARKAKLGSLSLPLRRRASFPPIMAAPPVVTASPAYAGYTPAMAATTLGAGAVYVSPLVDPEVTPAPLNRTNFSWLGATPTQRAYDSATNRRQVGTSVNVTGSPTACPYRVEFMHYGTAFEIMVRAAGGGYRIWVDDEPVARTVTSIPIDNQQHLIKTAFTSAALRKITLDFTAGMNFMGLIVAATDSVRPSSVPIGPRFIVGPADSYVDGANGVSGMDTFAFTLGVQLGFKDIWLSAIGGTGAVVTGGAGKNNFVTRAQPDVAARGGDLFFCPASVNDPGGNAFTDADLGVATQTVWETIRAANPNAIIVATGILFPSGTFTANMTAANDVLRARGNAAVASGLIDLYIDPRIAADQSPLNWFTGTGNNAAPNNTGNADIFKTNDVHPSQAGHDYLAAMCASRISQFLTPSRAA